VRNMNLTAQRICVWCGPIMVVIWGLSFWLLADMIPPPRPYATDAQTVAQFMHHTNQIRLGLVISLFACALLVPFCAVISAQMRRIEGIRSVLAQTQMLSGALLGVEFLMPFAIWQTAAYRIGHWDPQIVQMLNTMAWLMFLGIISSACIQVASLGLAILLDKGEQRVFPRWLGYYNLWAAILWIPAGCIPFFHHGPFAWNGVLAWWIPLTVFAIWFGLMVKYLLAAIKQDEAAQAAARALPPEPAGSRVPALQA
jgi:hypothetical protein